MMCACGVGARSTPAFSVSMSRRSTSGGSEAGRRRDPAGAVAPSIHWRATNGIGATRSSAAGRPRAGAPGPVSSSSRGPSHGATRAALSLASVSAGTARRRGDERVEQVSSPARPHDRRGARLASPAVLRVTSIADHDGPTGSPELEARTTTPKSPPPPRSAEKRSSTLSRARAHQRLVGEGYLGSEAVSRSSAWRWRMSDPKPAAERRAATGVCEILARRDREPRNLRRGVELAQQRAQPSTRTIALSGSTSTRVQRPQVDAERAVADRAAGDRVRRRPGR